MVEKFGRGVLAVTWKGPPAEIQGDPLDGFGIRWFRITQVKRREFIGTFWNSALRAYEARHREWIEDVRCEIPQPCGGQIVLINDVRVEKQEWQWAKSPVSVTLEALIDGSPAYAECDPIALYIYAAIIKTSGLNPS